MPQYFPRNWLNSEIWQQSCYIPAPVHQRDLGNKGLLIKALRDFKDDDGSEQKKELLKLQLANEREEAIEKAKIEAEATLERAQIGVLT